MANISIRINFWVGNNGIWTIGQFEVSSDCKTSVVVNHPMMLKDQLNLDAFTIHLPHMGPVSPEFKEEPKKEEP